MIDWPCESPNGVQDRDQASQLAPLTLVSIRPSAVYPELVEGLQGYSTAVRSGKALLTNLGSLAHG